jgi:DNA-binding beta-propeller fold protein YncE
VADGSAAQVAVAGDELIVTEKTGAVERVQLREGAVFGTPVAVALAEGRSNTPFGVTTRGSNVYVTFADSDTIGLVKNDRQTAFAAVGIPGGTGQHAPCWIAVVGPYLFTTNSPSHSVSRLIAGGANILLDDPVAAQTAGAPIDVAAEGDLLALVESDGGGASHLTQFRIDEDGNLTRTVSTPIASAANGIAIVTGG